MAKDRIHVSCNSCEVGVDFVRSGGDGPLKILQLTWEEVAELVEERGRDVVGDEAQGLASKIIQLGGNDELRSSG